jgi:hypothetical protein
MARSIPPTNKERKETMAAGKALDGEPYAGNPHMWIDEGASVATPRRGSLLYKSRFIIVAAALGAAGSLDAGTVAWYHLDEVAPGTPVTSDVRFLNAVDSAKLQGRPYSVSSGTLGSTSAYMPAATNDVADTVCVVDPVGGTTGHNARSLYFTYADSGSNPARYGGCVQVASDSSLSLADVTVEFFVRPLRLTEKTNNGWQLVAKSSQTFWDFFIVIHIHVSR